MAQTLRPHSVLGVLNSDGRPHPKENSLAAITLVLGAIAVFSTLSHNLHLLSSWSGLVGMCTGAWGQYISATTAERFILIIGLGAAGVGFLIGVAHGGLWGGL